MMKHTFRKITVLGILIVALSTAVDSQAQTDTLRSGKESKTWVLAIGISKYPKLPGGQQLQFADRDAMDFADAIRRSGVSADNLRVLIGSDATTSAIKSALGNWIARSASESDTVVIFFSGHGLYEGEYKQSYLLAYDSDPKDPFGTALSANDISQALGQRVRSRRVLIMADALRRDLFDPDTQPGAAAAFIQTFRELSASRAGVSAIIASSEGEFSREGQRWAGHGVFTKHLIDALSGAGERNGDGSITADELFEYLSSRLSSDTSNKQNPWRADAGLSQIMLARTQPQIAAVVQPKQAAEKTNEPVTINKPDINKPVGVTEAAKTPTTSQAVETRRLEKSTPLKTAEAASNKQVAPTAAVDPKSKQPDKNIANATTNATSDKPKPKVEPPQTAKPSDAPSAKTAPADVTSSSAPIDTRRAVPPPVTSAPSDVLAASVPGRSIESGELPASNASPSNNLPVPPKPRVSLPQPSPVTASPDSSEPAAIPSSLPATPSETGSATQLLQLEAAIYAKNFLEPKSASAWDIYQRLANDPAASAELTRLKPMLSEGLLSFGKTIVGGDVRADNIADKVDDFKRAGQIFARARLLQPANADVAALEKLCAAQALIALQFYDEAERSLAQLQNTKLAAIENSFGLIHQGKLDGWRAERAFKRAIELDPKWAAPHYNLALLYRSQQNQSALDELTLAAELDPSNAAVVAALGDEYFNRQQWERAADAFRKAVAAKPADDALHTKLGHSLFSQGKQDEANREYQKARELRGKQ